MGVTRGTHRRNYFSKYKETTFGTPVALYSYANLQGEMATPTAEIYSDVNECMGEEEETSRTLLARDSRVALTGRAVDVVTPLLLAFAVGADTKSALADATYSFQHRIQPAGIGTELYSFTHEQHSAGATDATAGSSMKWGGCVFDSFTISASRKGWVTMSGDIIAAGDYVTGASQTESGLAGPSAYYPVGSCNAWLSTGGLEGSFSVALPTTANTRVTDLHATGQIDLALLLRDFEYTCANNLLADDGYTLDSDTTRGQMIRDRRVQTIRFTLDFNSTSAPFIAYYAPLIASGDTLQTFAFQFSCVTGTKIYDETGTDYYHGFTLIFPQCRLNSEPTRGGSMGVQTISCEALVCDDGTNNTADFYFWNADDATYTAAVP